MFQVALAMRNAWRLRCRQETPQQTRNASTGSIGDFLAQASSWCNASRCHPSTYHGKCPPPCLLMPPMRVLHDYRFSRGNADVWRAVFVVKHRRTAMSAKFRKSLVQAALKTPGGAKTIDDRRDVAERLAKFCAEHNIQCRDVEHLKERHLKAYIEHRKTKAGARTLQTEMSHIRRILESANRHQLAHSPRLSNEALGLSGVSRTGTRQACPQTLYEQAFIAANGRDKAVAACMALQRTFGLRAEEAVQAGKSLNDWQKALDKGSDKLPVIYGTKGGKLRTVHVVDMERPKPWSLKRLKRKMAVT